MTIARQWIVRIVVVCMALMSLGFVLLLADMQARLNFSQQVSTPVTVSETAQPEVLPSETIPPSTPLPSVTPSLTLRPPPTFEPPTPTILPSVTSTQTPQPTLDVGDTGASSIRGLESPTPSSTPGCEPRSDWQLQYEVQLGDTLTQIAELYGVSIWELADANCIADTNVIVSGQRLRVPGGSHPQPTIECVSWEVLTPIDGAYNVDGRGQLTFNWRGPTAPRNLIRVIQPDGEIWERVIDLRQNETINLATELPQVGTHTWYVYPLDMNFQQISCREGGPWVFHSTGVE